MIRVIASLALLFATATAMAQTPAAKANPRVEISTSEGIIIAELYADKAPKSVENFLAYVKSGHYNGTIFHRVIDGFMLQAGGYSANLSLKSTREPIQNEANNGLQNSRYTLAMARTGDPHSATSQFFINVADNAFLDHKSPASGQTWGYAVFGKVVEGMEVVDAIAKLATTTKVLGTKSGDTPMEDVPEENVVIQSAKILEGAESPAAEASDSTAKPE